MEALVLIAERETATVATIALPTPAANQLLVRVHAVALNPVDALYVAHPLAATGRVVGSDFAGVVERGNGSLQQGTRVAGFLQGACSTNDRPGAFAEYLVCDVDLVWRVPDGMSMTDAATISLCSLTAAQALFYRLAIHAPFEWADFESPARSLESSNHIETTQSFFIYGASTSVGMYAAQLLRRSSAASGQKVLLIGAASRKHFQTLRSEPYRYDALVDYRDQDWPAQVATLSERRGLHFAYDCISEGQTVKQITKLLREDGRLAIVRSVEGGAFDADGFGTEVSYGAVWEGLGVEVQYDNMTVPASAKARLFAVEHFRWLSAIGGLVPNPIRLMPGSFSSIVSDGFALLGTGSMGDRAYERREPWMIPISGEKMVYQVRPE